MEPFQRMHLWACLVILVLVIMATTSVFYYTSTVDDLEISQYVVKPAKLHTDSLGVRTQTHTVLAEDFTATWCQYCPSASENLMAVYQSGNYDFYFVSMITDMVDEAQTRSQDLNIPGVPDVLFDGGYDEVVGAQENTEKYETSIAKCGARTVPDIDLEQHVMKTKNSSEIYVEVTVRNNDQVQYSGHIRSYVTEIVSRYKDYDGNYYPFGFIGFALDIDINIGPGGSEVFKAYWDGAKHSDTNGNDFSDISTDNIFVITAVFNSQPNPKLHNGSVRPYTAYYVDEVVATGVEDKVVDNIPPVVSIDAPSSGDVVSGIVEIIASAQDDVAVATVKYMVDTSNWIEMTYYAGNYHAFWDTRNVSDGPHTITVRAWDTSNNTAQSTINVQVLNTPIVVDTQPPVVDIVWPSAGETVSGSITLKSEVTDNVGVDTVEYSINDGPWYTMSKDASGLYVATIDTTKYDDGESRITVRATDTSGNENTDSVTIVINNSKVPEPQSQDDTTPPEITITQPLDGAVITTDTMNIEATVTDDSSIKSVEYLIDTVIHGTMSAMTNNKYTAVVSLTALAGGSHILKVSAEDINGNRNTATVTFIYTPGATGIGQVEIKSIVMEPEEVMAGDTVIVTVTLENYKNVKDVYVVVYEDNILTDEIKMMDMGNGEFKATIGPFDGDVVVKFKVMVRQYDGTTIESQSVSFHVKPKYKPTTNKEANLIPGFQGLGSIFVMLLVTIYLTYIYRKT